MSLFGHHAVSQTGAYRHKKRSVLPLPRCFKREKRKPSRVQFNKPPPFFPTFLLPVYFLYLPDRIFSTICLQIGW